MDKIKWAVNATGNIARQFADGMKYVDDAEITAVYSTGLDRAKAYAKEYGIDEKACYDDFDTMLTQGDFDVVYVCTPNHLHYDECMQCIRHGVNVLCEKPMADNLKQTRELFDAAKAADVFLLEGMWTRFFPVVKKVREWLSEGRIGEPKTVFVSFCANEQNLESQWRYYDEASGGALRDVGIYTIAFSYLVFGKQKGWAGKCEINEAGVDINNNIMLTYEGDQAAFMSSSLVTVSPYDGRIIGTEGQILVHPYFWKPMKAELYLFDGTVIGQDLAEVFEEEFFGSGFEYEIMAVGECLRENKKESEDYTIREIIDIAELMEDIRKEWGIVYKADSK